MQSSNQTKITSLRQEYKTYIYTNDPKHLQKYSITPSLRHTIREIKPQSLTSNTCKFDKRTPRNSHLPNIPDTPLTPVIVKLQPEKNTLGTEENISLTKLYNISLDNALYLFHDLLHQLIIIQQKIGHSYFNADDWCINANGILIKKQIELSHDLHNKNYEETAVVDLIIQYIKKSSWGKVFDDFYLFFKRAQIKSKCDFKYTLSLVQLYCKCSKINLKKSYQFPPKQKNQQTHFSELGSPVKTITSVNNSKNSNERANTVEDEYSTQFPASHVKSKSQEKHLCPKMSVKNIKKSAQITKKQGLKEYLKRMTHSNEIKNDYLKTCSKNVNDLQKQSSASTSNKTVNLTSLVKKKCVESLTFIPNKNQGLRGRDKTFLPFQSSKEFPCSLEADLQSVESKSQQNEENQVQQQFCQKAYQNNQWKRTFSNLLETQKQIAESFIEGKDEVIDSRQQPQNLGKLARVVVQSFLNAQNNSKYIIE